jgi:hypothetical protein
MNAKTMLILAALIGGAVLLGISAPAMADHGRHHSRYGPPSSYYYYVPPPVYYYSPPAVYVDDTPAYSYYDSYGSLVYVYVYFDTHHRPHYSYRYHRR